jgi:hypothetical protein
MMAEVEPATPQKAVFLPLIPNDGSPVFIAYERGSEDCPTPNAPRRYSGRRPSLESLETIQVNRRGVSRADSGPIFRAQPLYYR